MNFNIDNARKDFEYVTRETLIHQGHAEELVNKWLQRAPDGSDGYVEIATNIRWITWLECAQYYAKKTDHIVETQGFAALLHNLPGGSVQMPKLLARLSGLVIFVQLIVDHMNDKELSPYQVAVDAALTKKYGEESDNQPKSIDEIVAFVEEVSREFIIAQNAELDARLMCRRMVLSRSKRKGGKIVRKSPGTYAE